MTISRTEAKRLIEQGAVSVDGVRMEGADRFLELKAGRAYVLKVGKRKFVRIVAKG